MEEMACGMTMLDLAQDTSDRKILIAVDFGTTFSGVAWAQTRRPDVQTTIIQWPDASDGSLEGLSSEKVPTELRYEDNTCKWGFQVDDSGPRHRWFKLDLDPTQSRGISELSRQNSDTHALPPDYDASAGKLCTDYLSALRTHTEKVLQHKLPASIIKSTPIEYIITVPAVWSDQAQAKTRKCAFDAGMGNDLQIVSEPEAAAIYAFHAMDPHGIKLGDTFVLCDAGGGTVDLISYTVTALNPILQVKEAAGGSGRLCGSTFLNRIFQKYLVEKLSLNDEWDEEVVEDAMKRFDLVTKKAFRGDTGEEYIIPVPGLADDRANNVRRGKFQISSSVLKDIVFDPVVSEVVSLVEGQLAATKAKSLTVKAVLLVGGFGQSSYLRETIRAAIPATIEVMQPPNGWTAVVRGALMRGLTTLDPEAERVKVSSRVARKHYGTQVMSKYNARHGHSRATAWWDEYDGELKVFDMSWFITKGAPVTEDVPYVKEYHEVWKVSDGRPQTVVQDILVFADEGQKGAPLYKDTAEVRQLARLKADLSCLPRSELTQRVGRDGKMYFVVYYEIEMTYFSASTRYALVHKGVRYDSVVAEYV